MTVPEFLSHLGSLFNLCAVYYVIQLIRCAMASFVITAAVLLLRRTLFKNCIFLKAALWSLCFPALFAGRMKFYYENKIGVLLFTWWNSIFTRHVWLCWLYLGGVWVSFFLLCQKRKKLKKLALCMDKTVVDGTVVRVARLPVTPFAAGILKPVIVMPKVILQTYSTAEIQTILLHEKMHIRLCHLLFYALWDIQRALLWINPLLFVSTRLYREDLEEACDYVTIQKSSGSAYAYGQLLLKSMRLLQEECETSKLSAAFAEKKGYQKIRRRLLTITQYKPYKKTAAAGTVLSVLLLAACSAALIQQHSYGRYENSDSILVYEYHPKKQNARILAYAPESAQSSRQQNDQADSSRLRQMISFDDSYVYVDGEAFHRFLQGRYTDGEIILVFGGFYKLPGIAGYGYSCCYENTQNLRTVRIPYESRLDWRLRFVKLM